MFYKGFLLIVGVFLCQGFPRRASRAGGGQKVAFPWQNNSSYQTILINQLGRELRKVVWAFFQSETFFLNQQFLFIIRYRQELKERKVLFRNTL